METLSPVVSSSQKQHLALRVALDTMKDRCILQQKRLTEVEEENQQLRERLTQHKPNNTIGHNSGGVAENFQLRLQVSELQRQNAQLNAHIGMVSAENRKLWSRLSQIAKDQTITNRDNDFTLIANETDSPGGESSPRGVGTLGNQNLIRSKTFTQHSPNPNLRHKVITAEDPVDTSTMRDVSLEDNVAIEAYADDGTKTINDENVGQVTMGFGFLNVDDASSASSAKEQDFDTESKKCIEGLQNMRRAALKQQKDLNSVFALVESRLALHPCPDCVKRSQKPEMADKSLETDESLNDSKYTNSHQNGQTHLNETCLSTSDSNSPALTNHLNILQEKILADESNKICPMCGKIYDCGVTFESFCEHVEEHFRDDSIDLDQSMEHNFEYISHTVGDF